MDQLFRVWFTWSSKCFQLSGHQVSFINFCGEIDNIFRKGLQGGKKLNIYISMQCILIIP